MTEETIFPYLPQDEWEKARWQLKSQIRKVLKDNFDIYGLGVHIYPATELIWELVDDWGLRIRGVDEPIDLEYIENKRRVGAHSQKTRKAGGLQG